VGDVKEGVLGSWFLVVGSWLLVAGRVNSLISQASKATATAIRIINMDQGWTVPNANGVNINRKIRQDSMIMFVSWLVCWLVS
jgi:hypothetical protein